MTPNLKHSFSEMNSHMSSPLYRGNDWFFESMGCFTLILTVPALLIFCWDLLSLFHLPEMKGTIKKIGERKIGNTYLGHFLETENASHSLRIPRRVSTKLEIGKTAHKKAKGFFLESAGTWFYLGKYCYSGLMLYLLLCLGFWAGRETSLVQYVTEILVGGGTGFRPFLLFGIYLAFIFFAMIE
jgi:hypothetical protein